MRTFLPKMRPWGAGLPFIDRRRESIIESDGRIRSLSYEEYGTASVFGQSVFPFCFSPMRQSANRESVMRISTTDNVNRTASSCGQFAGIDGRGDQRLAESLRRRLYARLRPAELAADRLAPLGSRSHGGLVRRHAWTSTMSGDPAITA